MRRATQRSQHQRKQKDDFYPRSPCGERPHGQILNLGEYQFLSTLSLRRATHYPMGGYEEPFNFYPRSPCGERLWPGRLARPFFIISIHALLAESDRPAFYDTARHTYFYPRSPCGERQADKHAQPPTQLISIHALLAESDILGRGEVV